MNSQFSMISLLFILVFSSCGGELSPQKKEEMQHPEDVKFCDLFHNPEQYRDRTIRTEAIFYANLENAVLYSPECSNAQQYVWTDFDRGYQYGDNSIKEKFNDLNCQRPPCVSGKIKVSVVGRFEGPAQQGYGHLGAYRFRFLISQIMSAEPAP